MFQCSQASQFKLTSKKTDLDDCADAYVALAKNSSMTGQNIQIGRNIL